MKPNVKKWIIVGGLSVISFALGVAYLQYRKLMNYLIKLKGIKIKAISSSVFDFDLFLNFTNNSDLKFDIVGQEYKVYINDAFVTKLSNKGVINIFPKVTNTIGVNVNFNPTEVFRLLGKNMSSILLSPEKITIKLDLKLKVVLYGITLSIPYVYLSNLKEMMAKPKTE